MTLPSSSSSSSPSTTTKSNAIIGTSTVICTSIAFILLSCHYLQKHQRRKSLSLQLSSSNNKNDDNNDDDITSLLLSQESSSSKQCIYLDYNGTTPIYSPVIKVMVPFLSKHFGNPSSSHFYGSIPRFAVQRARYAIYSLLCPPPSYPTSSVVDLSYEESAAYLDQIKENEANKRNLDLADKSIIFVGCGTEADNMAIHLALHSTANDDNSAKGRKHIVTSNVEHPAVAECLKALEARGEINVTYVPVNTEGSVSASDMINAITPQTVLVTLMLANNESGALQPISRVASECRKRGILFHTDAAQAVGKVDVTLDSLGGPDMVTIVGHKFGAPKGVAALYIRHGCLSEFGRSEPVLYGGAGALLLGGGQEQGRRAGTENVPHIVGMGQAAELLLMDEGQRWKNNAKKMEHLRNRLLDHLTRHLGKDVVRPNGPSDSSLRLPNTLSVGLRDVQGGELLKRIQNEVAASAGSACHASGGKVSSILVAMKVPMEYAGGTLRLSVGPTTTEEEIDKAADIIVREAKRQLEG